MYIDVVDLADELIAVSARLVRLIGSAADIPLSMAQTRVLARLRDGGPLRVTDLARAERCAQPSMTSLVDRLEQSGHVTKTADTADGRAVYVAITERGRSELTAARASMAAVLAPRLTELTDEDRARLGAAVPVLARLMADIDH